MKRIVIQIDLFEKGDKVHTPLGFGTVIEDEVYSERDREVKVQHDKGTSGNVSNAELFMDRAMVVFVPTVYSDPGFMDVYMGNKKVT